MVDPSDDGVFAATPTCQGVKYMFVSNSDNLGATLDLKLLTHFAQSGEQVGMFSVIVCFWGDVDMGYNMDLGPERAKEPVLIQFKLPIWLVCQFHVCFQDCVVLLRALPTGCACQESRKGFQASTRVQVGSCSLLGLVHFRETLNRLSSNFETEMQMAGVTGRWV